MRVCSHGLLLALLFLCASCGGPPELVEKNEELDARIKELKQELKQIDKQLETKEGDITNDYRLTEAELLKTKAEATRVAGQLAELRDEKQSLEDRFDNYRRDFPIN